MRLGAIATGFDFFAEAIRTARRLADEALLKADLMEVRVDEAPRLAPGFRTDIPGLKTKGGEESHLEIPEHPKLQEIIDATPTVGMKTFLVPKTEQGPSPH